ncbi:MAG TPA: fibronectin type III domain-containing protein [Spirochaetia bacterium]|nr:fibronectin type III domain-containing protein [Spirochaetia bacterium]
MTRNRAIGQLHAPAPLVLCILLIACPALSALEKTIELGKDYRWSAIQSTDGVTTAPGRWGDQDLVLTPGAYQPEPDTDLLLHFDAPRTSDETGGYQEVGASPVLSSSISVMGSSAQFGLRGSPVRFQGQAGTLFSPGETWGDFTIEFWLYPATLSDGETVMSWSGSAHPVSESNPTQSLVSQVFRAELRDRRLVWVFQGLFTLPGGDPLPVTLQGTKQLLPRVWHHHLLRFQARRGTLEYLLDGLPEAIVHTTDSGSETGSIAVPTVGTARSGPLVLGEGLTGYVDELRISRRFVEDPMVARYRDTTGIVVSRVLDLGFSSTRILRIEAVAAAPADASVEYYYQVADTWDGRPLLGADTSWIAFAPPGDFKSPVQGRFIQLRVELYPDGTRTQSPRVSDLTVVYQPNLPPAFPAGLKASPGNGSVTLSWQPVNDIDVKGYSVYYGTAPHNYLGTGAAEGDSPLDAGTATSLKITGLSNGRLYYFSVVAYDTSQPPQRSDFAAEVSARPSRIYP